MRGPLTDLPIVLERATVAAGTTILLDDISLAISAGAPTVLLGPNGSGKTTLIRLAMGLIPATQGRVTWGGREHVPSARRAIVFQRPVMLRRSAAGNLSYALAAAGVTRTRRTQRAEELLALVGLIGLGGRPARKLSGGEQQRLALARALAKNPDVIFLDEPTAGLDPPGMKAVEDVIRDLAARGVKIVMATHHLGEARRLAGDVVLLHRGRIAEHAEAQTFFSQPRTVEAQRFMAGELVL